MLDYRVNELERGGKKKDKHLRNGKDNNRLFYDDKLFAKKYKSIESNDPF